MALEMTPTASLARAQVSGLGVAVRQPPQLGQKGDAREENGDRAARRKHVWVEVGRVWIP